MAKNDAPKRDDITFRINDQVRKSAASNRFVEEFRASNQHAVKREKAIGALRSGQMLEEAGLQPVFAYLDTEGYENLDVKQRQLLVLARLQEYLGVIPQSVPVAVPVEAVSQPPAEQPAAVEQAKAPEPQQEPQPQQAQSQKSEQAIPPAPAEKKPGNPLLAGFANKLSG